MAASTVCLLTDESVHALTLERSGRSWSVVSQSKETFVVPNSLCIAGDWANLAKAIARALNDRKAFAGDVHLVLPLNWSFAQVLPKGTNGFDEESLPYELEPFLPMPLEELTCAFASVDGEQTVGFAVPTEPLAELLASLEQENIELTHIGLDVLAALQKTPIENRAQGVMLIDSRWLRTLIPANGQASCQSSQTLGALWVPQRPQESSCPLLFDLRENNSRSNIPETIEEQCIKDPLVELVLGELALVRAFNLRAGSLAGSRPRTDLLRLVNHCMVWAIVLVLVYIAGTYLGQRSIARTLATLDQTQRAVYRQVFDSGTFPVGAATRVASERIRLEALTRTPRKASPGSVNSPAALDVLRDVTSALPSDVRIMLADARLDENQLTLRGQTVEHGDAERIVQAMRKLPALDVHPPRTNRLPSGEIEFLVTAGSIHER